MSNDIGKYLKFLRDLENGLVEDEEHDGKVAVSLLESQELFEDSDLSFNEMADRLSIVESDVKELFSIIGTSQSPEAKLSKISGILSGGGVESTTIKETEVSYVVMSDIYDDTIISINGKFYFGSLGRVVENKDISSLTRIS